VLSGGSIVRFPAGSEIPELPGVPLKDCGAPSYIAADSRGKLYVVDSSKNTVIKYDSGIKKEGEIGAGKLTVPKRVYAGPDDRIYIIDVPTPDRIIIKIFSSKGELERQFGVLKGYKASNYESLAITPKGEIYINNMRANTIMCYNSKGGFLGSFSATKDGSAKVTYPAGLAGGDGGFFVLPVAEILVLKNIEYSK
ncbi:MAG TPA: hypothetical protein P5511_05855, partial [Candidatus Goldiibacteriota bacterium]|nr:hypothetical protein [Candidatus Goldiibacteriota bacterium]